MSISCRLLTPSNHGDSGSPQFAPSSAIVATGLRMMAQMYQVKKQARSEFVPIRNLQYHVQVWGEPSPDKIPLVLVHGWMDVAASYQFVVAAFSQDHSIIAPDWRGYG